MSTIEQIKAAALSLPEDQRELLCSELEKTLGPQIDPAAWDEIVRRREELLSGKVQGVTSEEFSAAMRKQFPWWP